MSVAETMNAIAAIPVVELVVIFAWVSVIRGSWQHAQKGSRDSADERQLAATVILGELSGITTASSVLIAGIGAFVALVSDEGLALMTSSVRWSLFYAVLWAVMAMLLALYTMATLPTRTPNESFVRSYPVALLTGTALLFPFLAGVRFLAAVYLMLLA